jgi:hypothetical protein
MSGVEAILGMAASGAGLVSLGIQLGESAVKLRRIYHAAKDAPRTVSRLVFGLETMAMALQELELHRQQNSHSGAPSLAASRNASRVQPKYNTWSIRWMAT